MFSRATMTAIVLAGSHFLSAQATQVQWVQFQMGAQRQPGHTEILQRLLRGVWPSRTQTGWIAF